MQFRTAQEGADFHRKIEPRIYETQHPHEERILKSRGYVSDCLQEKTKNQSLEIIELGCGTGDISGFFAQDHAVIGLDCSGQAVKVAKERFPWGTWREIGSIEYVEAMKSKVLVLCEFLEHIPLPLKLVEAWLPLAEHVVISHPLNEPLESPTSAGEHQWSFSDHDFAKWFEVGGHELVKFDLFRIGCYEIIIGRGKKV